MRETGTAQQVAQFHERYMMMIMITSDISFVNKCIYQSWHNGVYYLYRCTVHSVVYLINTPTNAHICVI